MSPPPARPAAVALVAAILAAAAAPGGARAEEVAVRHVEGVAHGFLVVRTKEGEALGEGDLTQVSRRGVVTAKLVLRLRDGSTREETTVYEQRKVFRMLTNHVVQKGPAFKVKELESWIERSGRVRVRWVDDDGKQQSVDEHMDLPPDVANGLPTILVKNIPPSKEKTTVSMVAVTPKPRLVHLEITPSGEEPFATSGHERKATHFTLKISVPGATGVIASMLGKIPEDSHFWIIEGEAPTFVRAETPLFSGEQVWRVDLACVTWPGDRAQR
ncbi:MAG TPA: hypothetical protein VFP65_20110 [Anaeromyxobacteraceae bacterium]|nr:hypothetical protein [Anaeromyxobacteraceae bacterium]